jgi:hypothetical protein
MKLAVEYDPRALRLASPDLQTDFELLKISLTHHGYERFIPFGLRDDGSKVIKLIEELGKEAWKYIEGSGKLRDDADFMSRVLRVCPRALEYASAKLRENRELVLLACEKDPHCIHFASHNLRVDREMIVSIVQKHGRCAYILAFLPLECRKEEKFMAELLRIDLNCISYCSLGLLVDEKFCVSSIMSWYFQHPSEMAGLVSHLNYHLFHRYPWLKEYLRFFEPIDISNEPWNKINLTTGTL